jgi:DNA mismatch repair protein MutS2
MAVANQKTLRDLEFDRLKALVGDFAASSLGREAVERLEAVADRQAIEAEIALVNEAMTLLAGHGRLPLAGAHDLAPLLERAKEHGLLLGEELVIVLSTLDATQEVRALLLRQETLPLLRRLGERLSDAEGIMRAIRRTVDERGEVRDDASPALVDLSRRRKAIEGRIEERLRSLIERHPDLISEPVVTRRLGRLVVPIKSGALGAMEFVVHDRSATGQTLYAEPASLVAENNRAAELEAEIREERLRVLREVASLLLHAESALLRDRETLERLDSLAARAGYALAHDAAFPRLGDAIALVEARHPLLPRDRVVPVSLSVGKGARMVVLTGPNTGGKTVTLKTAGLLTLMVQSGIPIPASPESTLTVLATVRSDIGDEQSIEQNLSTFSGHMRNLVLVLGEAGPDSLLLLDELGAGTDPQEGAALGLSILEHLLEARALVLASTHLTPLKYFAVRHPGVKTASMEFDLATLSPTFRVVEGVPGKSNAFVIAERLGLPSPLVARARALLSQGEIRAEDILEDLERERQAIVHLRRETEIERSRAEGARTQYEARLARFEETREKDLRARLKSLEHFLRESQEHVEELLSRLNEHAELEEARTAYREVSALREAARAEQRAAQSAEDERPLPVEEIEVGKAVHVRSLRADGRVIQLASPDKVTVDLGGIRVQTEVADLAAPRSLVRPERERPRVPLPSLEPVSLQLNVRGMTVSEALREVEAYLDRLLRADIRAASVLHGKGTGALREAVRSYLASSRAVQAFRSAPPQEGGDGVTVFEIGEEA